MAATPIADPSILTNANTPQTLQAWTNLLDSIFPPTTNRNTTGSESSSQTTTTDSAANDPIKQLLALLIPGATGGVDNPQNKALIAQLFTQFREGAEGLSGIQAAGNSARVYNSSTMGLLGNDAMARAIAAAAAGMGTQQNQQQQIIAQLLATLSAGSKTTTQTGTRNTTGSESSGKSGGLGSAAGKATLGAAGAAAATKALAKIFEKNRINDQNAKYDSAGDAEGDYPEYPAQGRSDRQDETNFSAGGYGDNFGGDSGLMFGNDDPGAIDSIDQFENSNTGDFSDPFGIGGFDIGDFVANDSSEINFDFIDGFTGIDFIGGDSGDGFGDGSGGYEGFDFGGDF